MVIGFTLQILVRSLFAGLFEHFSLNFTKMFVSGRMYAETLNQLCLLKVKVTLQGHGIYH